MATKTNNLVKRIAQFIKKYPEPQQTPITLQWKRKDGEHQQAYFVKNGEKRPYPINTGHNIINAQLRYDEKLGLCEFAYAEFPHSVPKPNENRRWKYVHRYFLPKGERMLYDHNGLIPRTYDYLRASYSSWTYNVAKFAQQFSAMLGWRNPMFENEFLKMIGEDIQCKSHYGNNTICNAWQLEYWFDYTPKTRTNGKTQQIIDQLVAETLADPDADTMARLRVVDTGHYWRTHGNAYFDAIHNVFRCFTALKNGELVEDKRVYMGGKKPIVAYFTKDVGWVPNGSFTDGQFTHNIINFNDVVAMKYCGYLKSLIERANPSVYQVVSIMRNSEIEKLCNMGLNNLAKRFADDIQWFKSKQVDYFGTMTKSKNVCQKYQLTKKQLDYVNEHMQGNRYYDKPIPMLKRIYGDNLSSLDYNTFTTMYGVIQSVDGYRINNLLDNSNIRSAVIRFLNMETKHAGAFSVFYDACNAYNYISLANKPQIKPWECKSYEEIVRCHDTCVAIRNLEIQERERLYRMQQEERNKELEKKMAKLDKERAKMNYEDDEFIIRIPKALAEIVNEGSTLHHCVGGYTTSHAQGDTTIVFLRRKSAPDTSFYTIEVSANNVVKQIHGFGNKWLGNNPEAIPTVVRWLRKNGITCSNEILTCKSTGYCQTREYVAMPQVD